MDLIKTLAKMLAGMQAPLSLGLGVLGAAEEPYREVLREVPGFGWKTPEDFEPWLRERLQPGEAQWAIRSSLGVMECRSEKHARALMVSTSVVLGPPETRAVVSRRVGPWESS
jgi:hypothetical protein